MSQYVSPLSPYFQEKFKVEGLVHDGEAAGNGTKAKIYLARAIQTYLPDFGDLVNNHMLDPSVLKRRTTPIQIIAGQVYAIKVVKIAKPRNVHDWESVDLFKRMKREVQIGLSVTPHPHVLSYYDYHTYSQAVQFCPGKAGCTYYFVFDIVMELGDRTLDHDIAEGKRFSAEETIYAVRQMLHGLDRLEAEKCVHRDLKPDNFLIVLVPNPNDPDGPPMQVIKVFDFDEGAVFDEGVSGRASVFGGLRGNAVFMAPEKAVDGFYTFKGDVWSVGVIAIEMMFGRPNPLEVNSAWVREARRACYEVQAAETLTRTVLVEKEKKFCDLTLEILKPQLDEIQTQHPELHDMLTQKILTLLSTRHRAAEILGFPAHPPNEMPVPRELQQNFDLFVTRKEEEQLLSILFHSTPNNQKYVVVQGAEGSGRRSLIGKSLKSFVHLKTKEGSSHLVVWWDGSTYEKFVFSLRRSFSTARDMADKSDPFSKLREVTLVELIRTVLIRVHRNQEFPTIVVIENVNPQRFGGEQRMNEVWKALEGEFPTVNTVLLSTESEEMSKNLTTPENTIRLDRFSDAEVKQLFKQTLRSGSNRSASSVAERNADEFAALAGLLCKNDPCLVSLLAAEAKTRMENEFCAAPDPFLVWIEDVRGSIQKVGSVSSDSSRLLHDRTIKYMKAPFGTLGEQLPKPEQSLYDKLMRLCRVMHCDLLPMSYIRHICTPYGHLRYDNEFVDQLKRRNIITDSSIPDVFQLPSRHFLMLEPDATYVNLALQLLLWDRPEGVSGYELWLLYHRNLKKTANALNLTTISDNRELQERALVLFREAGLSSVSYFGDEEGVSALLASNPLAVHELDAFQRTPLYSACRNQNVNPGVIKRLIEAGSNVNARSTDYQSLPTHGLFYTIEQMVEHAATMPEDAVRDRLRPFKEASTLLRKAGADFSGNNSCGEMAVGKLLNCLRNHQRRGAPLSAAITQDIESLLSELPRVYINVIDARKLYDRSDYAAYPPAVLDSDFSLCVLEFMFSPGRFSSTLDETELTVGLDASILLNVPKFQAVMWYGQFEVTLQIPELPEKFPQVCPGSDPSRKFVPRWEVVMPVPNDSPRYIPLDPACIARNYHSMFTTGEFVGDDQVVYHIGQNPWKVVGPPGSALNGGILRWVPCAVTIQP